MTTKVVLVQPYYENIWEPIGLGFIAGYLKKHFVGDIEIICYQGNFDTDEDIVEGSLDADVVGFSCSSPAWPHALRLAESVALIQSFKEQSRQCKIFPGQTAA